MSIFKGNVNFDIPNLRPRFILTPKRKDLGLIDPIQESGFKITPLKLSVRLTYFSFIGNINLKRVNLRPDELNKLLDGVSLPLSLKAGMIGNL